MPITLTPLNLTSPWTLRDFGTTSDNCGEDVMYSEPEALQSMPLVMYIWTHVQTGVAVCVSHLWCRCAVWKSEWEKKEVKNNILDLGR